MTEKDADDLELHSVPTMTHGRVLVRPARASAARGVLVGFHGYGETAAIQMQRLQAIPGALSWTLGFTMSPSAGSREECAGASGRWCRRFASRGASVA